MHYIIGLSFRQFYVNTKLIILPNLYFVTYAYISFPSFPQFIILGCMLSGHDQIESNFRNLNNVNVTYFLLALPKITFSAPAPPVLPWTILTCSAIGNKPIYIALIRNAAVLQNTTATATTKLSKDGNYTCIATNKYGTQMKQISVVFTGETFHMF